MEESVISYLIGSSALQSLGVSNVYLTRAPQNVAVPYATMQRISGNRDMHMQGPSGLVSSRVQIDCYGLTYAASKKVARAVEARLSGFSGSNGSTTFDGIFLDAERDDYSDDATPSKLFRTSLDFIIWHKET
jgi:hypothetical protein